MNYIILDMEWDNAYFYKEQRFINQILQIGAVKLNEAFEIIDIFEVVVKSSISKKVSKRFRELTGITSEMMGNGVSFKEAVEMYNSWVGKDIVTMTWSTSDLYSIAANEKVFLKNLHIDIGKYLDLQCFIQGELRLLGHEIKSQISLQNAATLLNVGLDEYNLHTAKDDSLLSAALLKKCYDKKRFQSLIKDTTNPEFYQRLYFKPYYISDIKSKYIKKKHLKISCNNCGKKAIMLNDWKFKNRFFTADFICKKCNKEFVARLSFKKNFDNTVFKKKIIEKSNIKNEENQDELQPLSAQM